MRAKRLLISIIIYPLLSVSLATATPAECLVKVVDNFEECIKTKGEHFKEPFCTNSTEIHHYETTEECLNKDICAKMFTVSRIPQQIFSGTMKPIILSMFQMCCGKCARCLLESNLSNTWQVEPYFSINASDVVFPVLGNPSMKDLYGYHFVPVFDVPSAYYFTLQITSKEIMEKLILACFHMWRLLTICFLMALISGFIAWTMETWANVEEFPRSFYIGLFEGFWWSFVSMTTVGYGDKTIKSYPGRIFAILWILTGVTVCAIFTATLTTEIINARSPANPEMNGKVVGALKYRLHESTMIAQHGGILNAIEYNSTVSGIGNLFKKLQRKEIHGVLINRATYYYFARLLKDKVIFRDLNTSINAIKLRRREKNFRGQILTAGILFKKTKHYNYFRRYFENNRFQIQGCNSFKLNYKANHSKYNFMSLDGGLFEPFLHYTLVILGCILIFGVFYEYTRYRVQRQHATQDEDINIREDIYGRIDDKTR